MTQLCMRWVKVITDIEYFDSFLFVYWFHLGQQLTICRKRFCNFGFVRSRGNRKEKKYIDLCTWFDVRYLSVVLERLAWGTSFANCQWEHFQLKNSSYDLHVKCIELFQCFFGKRHPKQRTTTNKCLHVNMQSMLQYETICRHQTYEHLTVNRQRTREREMQMNETKKIAQKLSNGKNRIYIFMTFITSKWDSMHAGCNMQ